VIGVVEAFSPSYALARRKFLQGCVAAGLTVDAHPHPLKGKDGEDLAMDVAYDGPADAQQLLLVTSACHGIEGHCGSGVQVFALHDTEWREKARAAGVGVLYVHALNPHGFSYGRRVTHENVDLNRNFMDFTQPLPVNAAYAELHPLLLPKAWPPSPSDQVGALPPTWSNRTLRQVLQKHAQKATKLAWIDLHTGLGPNGHGERIFACRDDAAAYARANGWWGGETAVTSTYDGSSTSPLLTGLNWGVIYDECPQAEYTGIALEYGTEPVLEVLGALRADHWLHKHPDAAPELADAIQARMRDAFYTDTDGWKGQVISQARQAMFQAVDGLSRA
jgi:hypothetical protein